MKVHTSETAVLVVFAVTLIGCILAGIPILAALALGYLIFFAYTLSRGYTVRDILGMSWKGIKTAKNILITFLLIGMLTALWRAAGTIPAIVSYCAGLMNPAVMILMAFLLNALVSVLTGTAFGTAATMGVICMTMAKAMGCNEILAGGAILSGVFFGDRCSPVSTSALLVAELTETGIYTNIKNMIKSALAPFTITCILYLTVSIQLHGKTEMPDLGHAFGSEFRLSWIALLPAAVILLLSVVQAGVKIAMIASIVTAIPVCIGLQNMAFTELPELLLNGFHSTDVTVAAMLNGGGITSMLKVGAIVCISSSYSGIFQATGILNGFQKMVCLLANRTKPYFAVLVASILTSVMACNQTLAIMLTDQLCSRTEPDKLRFANNLEDSAVLIAPLVPWSIACAVPLTAAGAPGYSVLFAVFLYLLPLCDLVLKK